MDRRAVYLGTLEGWGSYSHKIAAVGGYLDMSLSLGADMALAEEWLTNGAGRHVEVYDETGVEVWEGFVDEVATNIGGLSVTRGPLMDVCNALQIIYCLISTTTGPEIVGPRTVTGWITDANSIARYGTFRKALTGGDATTADVTSAALAYLAQSAEPALSKSFTLGSATTPSISLKCRGYMARLDYPFTAIGATGTLALSVKLANILDADPNALFSSTNASIATNALAVPAYEDKERQAWAMVKALLAMGDVSGNRYLFSVGDGLKCAYAIQPSVIEYYHRVSEPSQPITTAAGAVLEPWQVRPGKWILFSDFLTGTVPSTDPRDDPRAMFIESVTYSAAWGLQLEGSKEGEPSQKLGRLGLGGIGG
jgi:hypothetical protein